MARAIFFLALVALFTFAFSDDVKEAVEVEEASDRSYYHIKCPCKCFGYGKEHKADKQCWKKKFLYRCKVSECYKGYYKGKWCCDKDHYPTTKYPPTKPTTPKVCPCQCKKKYDAEKDCQHKPWCKLLECPKKYGYGGYSNWHYTEYKCCKEYH